MTNRFKRTALLLGKEKMSRLKRAHVAVVGCGAVGGYAIEALARAGIGQLTVVDFDVISKSNINRQILALDSTIGQKKGSCGSNGGFWISIRLVMCGRWI